MGAKDKKLAIPESTDDMTQEWARKVSEPVEATVAVATRTVPVVPAVSVTFDRWFSQSGRPAHHKGGLQAFANTSGKRTVATWDAIFKNY